MNFLDRIKCPIFVNRSTTTQMILKVGDSSKFVMKSIETDDYDYWEPPMVVQEPIRLMPRIFLPSTDLAR